MKVILFCTQSYTFAILKPLADVCREKGYPYLWFTTKKVENLFPFRGEPHTSEMNDLKKFKADAIFAPGNTVPHYLHGLKVQIFHGLAGEKKSHFKIREYFDLYLTQGPYFTKKFNELKEKHRNFDVIETGWPKLDVFAQKRNAFNSDKQELLRKSNAQTMILFAPTHNSSMIAAPHLLEEFKKLAENPQFLTIVKFHSLTDREIIDSYKTTFKDAANVIISDENDITKLLLMADIMVSDTSSVVYEFQLLDKPVLTFKTQATNILWDNAVEYDRLEERITKNLESDPFAENRRKIIADYHPYNDGKSALRMIEAAQKVISEKGVPKKRKVSLKTKFRIFKLYTLRNK